MKIIIPIAPRTKKNSQQIAWKGGRPIIIPSAAYKMYEREARAFLTPVEAPINYPVNVKCLYYMPTRRRVDLVNLQECTLDVLVKYGVLEDDESKIVVSMDGSRVFYDKKNPRTEVIIESIENDTSGIETNTDK